MIQTIYVPEHYTGDGVTAALPFTWRILAKSDVLVLAKHPTTGVVTTLVLDSDYTIANDDVDVDVGGDVVLDTPGDWEDYEIFILRETAKTQLVNLTEESPFPVATVNKVFDRLTMMVQELRYLARKALKFANASTFVDVDVPDPEDNQILAWLGGELVNADVSGTTVQIGDEVAVDEEAGFVDVVFATPLSSADYQVVSITTNWNTTADWSNKTVNGFRITFGSQAPASAKAVWRVIP